MNLAATLLLATLASPGAAVDDDGKGQYLRAFNQAMKMGRIRDDNGAFYRSKDDCDIWTEETCYDDNYDPVSCASIDEGGCPCLEGEEKCGAFEGYAGTCTTLCCDSMEETCYDYDISYDPLSCAPIAEGGCPCPEGEVKCGASDWYAGYCTTLCCDHLTEEACYDYDVSYDPVRCAPISEGGCPCPEGEEKCGAFEGYAGYCTSVCCDSSTEETCYDDNYDTFCAPIEEGGCPCPEGEEKCGAYEGYAGYCTSVCCDPSTEETCYDDNLDTFCAAIDEGGCPCPEGEEKCGASEGFAGYCTTLCCDSSTEETCYDYDVSYDPVSCAPIADGCPCREGEEKCGAFEGYGGYCTSLCCDSMEETCYDDAYNPISCAPFGGCPCAEGEVKCGASDGSTGYCAKLCCDGDSAETTCPAIDGYTFAGVGWCQSEEGLYYPYETVYGVQTVEECAMQCGDTYSDDDGFVGINWLEHVSWTNCNCMFSCDDNSNDVSRTCDWQHGKGPIAGANGVVEEVCYSYDEAKQFSRLHVSHAEMSRKDGLHGRSDLVELFGTPQELAYYSDHKKKLQKLHDIGATAPMVSARRAIEQKIDAVVDAVSKRQEGKVNAPTIQGVASNERNADKRREGEEVARKNRVAKLIAATGTAEEASYFRELESERQKLSVANGDRDRLVRAKFALGQKELALARAIKRRGDVHDTNLFAHTAPISLEA